MSKKDHLCPYCHHKCLGCGVTHSDYYVQSDENGKVSQSFWWNLKDVETRVDGICTYEPIIEIRCEKCGATFAF